MLSDVFVPLSRKRDRKRIRTADIVYDLDDRPPPSQSVLLAFQSVALQSVYFVVPAVAATAFGMDGPRTVDFLCVSILAIAIGGLLQGLTRGPLGSGYAIPYISGPVFLGAYLLAAQSGSIEAAGGMVVAAALVGTALTLLLRRLSAVLPTEVAGVVVFLIGVSLLPRTFDLAARGGIDPSMQRMAVLVALGSLAVMIVVALTRTPMARFAVLIGAAAGCVTAISLGLGTPNAEATLAGSPWFALPTPSLPNPSAFDMALLPAFLLALVAFMASGIGDTLAFQRAADGGWTKPDDGPVRRGLLAGMASMALAGLLGGMVPASSSACIGLSIATRAMARRIVMVGAGLLVLLACCPKLVALFTLIPSAVKAAMLAYVCCFMIASGAQLITMRMLDARRTFTVGAGLFCGLGVLIAPELFAQWLPRALTAPVTAGALAALILHILTQPFVIRSAAFRVRPGAGMQQQILDQCAALGGAWGTKRDTMDRVGHCLLEMSEVLADRGTPDVNVSARFADDQVEVTLGWQGEPLPQPSARPDVDDLMGPMAAQEAFAIWLATRQAIGVRQRSAGARQEFRCEFAD
jgi:xanthine permease XanP